MTDGPTTRIERWSGLKASLYSLFSGNPPSNRAIVEHAALGGGDRVLDVGCGPGAALEHARAAGAEVAGIDPSPSMVRKATARVPGAKVIEGSAEQIGFPDNSFTHAWTVSAFHHWADPDAGIDEAFRVLADGGKFFIVEKKLKEGKTGHGLSRKDADAVAMSLDERGFTNTGVARMRAGRSDYVVVTGTVPRG